MPESTSAIVARIDERTAAMAKRLDALWERLDGVCDVQGEHAERLARVETHVGLVAGLSALLSAVAAYLGVKR